VSGEDLALQSDSNPFAALTPAEILAVASPTAGHIRPSLQSADSFYFATTPRKPLPISAAMSARTSGKARPPGQAR
jgi:hypothetical protein